MYLSLWSDPDKMCFSMCIFMLLWPQYALCCQFDRAHFQEVASHLRCTIHPTELLRTGRVCSPLIFLCRSFTTDNYSFNSL